MHIGRNREHTFRAMVGIFLYVSSKAVWCLGSGILNMVTRRTGLVEEEEEEEE
jgi:hypothetical protein